MFNIYTIVLENLHDFNDYETNIIIPLLKFLPLHCFTKCLKMIWAGNITSSVQVRPDLFTIRLCIDESEVSISIPNYLHR